MTSNSLSTKLLNTKMKVSLLEKLFIWSLITEPLLFFILSPASLTGLPLTLSRLFQISFLLLYFFNICFGAKRIQSFYPLRNYNYYVIIYCVLILTSSLIGWNSGNYLLNHSNEIDQFGVQFRSAFELFILIYYFVYFLMLPRVFIHSKVQLNYFFKWLTRVLYVVIFFGLLDILANVIGFDLIPRHLVDSSWTTVGWRFHSLAGEPRDAFVFLMFGFAILYLMAGLNLKKPPRIGLTILILTCLMLTQSFSGVIGVIAGLTLFVFFTKISFKNAVLFLILIFLTVILGYISLENSPRIQLYVKMLLTLREVMEGDSRLPYLVYVQSPDLVPLWLFINKPFEYDFYHFLFGSGISSASFATNNFMDMVTAEINNPRAQITRLLFDSGIIGTYIYLIIHIKPIRKLRRCVPSVRWSTIWLSSIMLFGAVLGHRSNVGLIFAGIVLAILANRLHYPYILRDTVKSKT